MLVISHLTTQRNAIAMLHARIQFLHQYLLDCQNGLLPLDNDILRQISTVCRRSPLMNSEAFSEQFSTVNRNIFVRNTRDSCSHNRKWMTCFWPPT